MEISLKVELTEDECRVIKRQTIGEWATRPTGVDYSNLILLGLLKSQIAGTSLGYHVTKLGEQAKAILSKKADSDQEVVR